MSLPNREQQGRETTVNRLRAEGKPIVGNPSRSNPREEGNARSGEPPGSRRNTMPGAVRLCIQALMNGGQQFIEGYRFVKISADAKRMSLFNTDLLTVAGAEDDRQLWTQV